MSVTEIIAAHTPTVRICHIAHLPKKKLQTIVAPCELLCAGSKWTATTRALTVQDCGSTSHREGSRYDRRSASSKLFCATFGGSPLSRFAGFPLFHMASDWPRSASETG